MIELPDFDTGEYEGSEFLIAHGAGKLTIHIVDRKPFVVVFSRIRWHEFTALCNCTKDKISGAYFRVHEVNPSPFLIEFMEGDAAVGKVYRDLHHYRIFLDETGCHEVFAESARAVV
ncbi:MAG: hypothetical protein U1F26_07060 [Lysobacterales bacterium]